MFCFVFGNLLYDLKMINGVLVFRVLKLNFKLVNVRKKLVIFYTKSLKLLKPDHVISLFQRN